MNAAEVEFMSEKATVKIVPNFACDRLYLISQDIGPFHPGIPLEVPLWIGLNLRQRGKCRFLPLPWMDIEKLSEKKEEESQSKVFTQMPIENYLIVAQLILSVSVDDIPDAQQVKTLIKDIWDLRLAKLRSSIAEFIQSEGVHAKLNHLTLHELNTARPLLPHALDQLNRISKTQQSAPLNSTPNFE